VVNGSEDDFVHFDCAASLPDFRPWEGKAHSLPGLGHAPSLQGTDTFNPSFARWLTSTGAACSEAPPTAWQQGAQSTTLRWSNRRALENLGAASWVPTWRLAPSRSPA
jgi:hypothetical protein